MRLTDKPQVRITKKMHSELLAQKIAELFSDATSNVRLIAGILLMRACLGALMSVALCFHMLVIVGGVWGAVIRAAPCYGGGEPSRVEGALFGAFATLLQYGWWVLPAGACVGAVLGQLFLPRQGSTTIQKPAPRKVGL